MAVTLYHNPRCSKSRQTLALLEEKGISPNIVLYLETPPDQKTLQTLLKQLGLSARELLRKGEQEYKDNHLKNPELDDDALIKAMVQYPKLIERPIVVHNGQARIGRPPESVLEIL
ncbi:arsenate reductase [Endozoicomonas montiporae]|uniref:Arsenate reductase n=2 Tax=Endozoicomonas montiporae TaxID=1027273 RepID=A0A081N9U0_9GAMM|nr:arsenate reductase (glutaredoxin) [Endozoicomonas montiporae]AMO57128.1 arsenate reductase [Endozoicomonas montiporae CL-33]KEQ15213.1 arsenate reductase [Endozoicomonas montiporae]